ncbi:iron-sulfur cluster insertion protein ErpA [Buchnera aphidicola]|uniref:Iron-sulfur cluster insertion protein ErpA n=1 Tax=Buchnera aphidicola subsp. Melaphis rhois TaxID=118103 RepID=A0A4D6YAW2_BUCMH|nr:iron-sulfur cluster insertion protein ErpA [Buchnera aphidicola]QCI23228.1 iron-sulfur cluster insertion protein ErpA [Buchnera aphidicola (Melaphis rhois)]
MIYKKKLPLSFSDSAIKKIHLITKEKNISHLKLRIYITGGGCSGFQYNFKFDTQKYHDDIIITQFGVSLVVDPISLQYLSGGKIDYQENLNGSKFTIFNPKAKTTCSCGASFST